MKFRSLGDCINSMKVLLVITLVAVGLQFSTATEVEIKDEDFQWEEVREYVNEVCEDNHYRCILWAHQGHCDLMFMQVFCCATCSAPGVLPTRRPRPRPRPTWRPWTWRPRPQ